MEKNNFKGRFILALLVILFSRVSPSVSGQEIHIKHILYGLPIGTPASNDLIVRDCYALSSNDETKLADWVAYRLDASTVTGAAKTSRKWKADPWLDPDETLEPADYRGAHALLKVDRGHQAPLASFKGTDCWEETNYLSNITPQKTDLNQGPWKTLEDKVRSLAEKETVWVITGPLYERDMKPLPMADEPNKVPSGYWKIVIVQDQKSPYMIKVIGYVFDQETPRKDGIADHQVSVDEIESRSHLDFMWELPDGIENDIEQMKFKSWFD